MVHIESLNNLHERIANAVAHYWNRLRPISGAYRLNIGKMELRLNRCIGWRRESHRIFGFF
jgi:hypothetical protein